MTALAGDDDPACDDLTLEEALSRGLANIREVSAHRAINELHVFNAAGKPLLIVDGEELAGSVQNRVINLSVLVGKRSAAQIPVSCVERGRCAGKTFRFTSASRMQFASGRAKKMAQVSRSLASHNERQGNQVAIWSDIARKAERMQAHSNTQAMAAIYEQHAAALEEYGEAFGIIEGSRGALFTVHGRVAGLELFDSTSTWARLMPKIVRSYAIDALEERTDLKKSVDIAPSVLLDVLAEAETSSCIATSVFRFPRMSSATFADRCFVLSRTSAPRSSWVAPSIRISIGHHARATKRSRPSAPSRPQPSVACRAQRES